MIRLVIASVGIALVLIANVSAQDVQWPYPNGTLRDLWMLLANGEAPEGRIQEYRQAEFHKLNSTDSRQQLDGRVRLALLLLAQKEFDRAAAEELVKHVQRLEADSMGVAKRNARYLNALTQLKLSHPQVSFTLLRSLAGEGDDDERLVARKLLALIGGWFPSEMPSDKLTGLMTSIGSVEPDLSFFPPTPDWEAPALALHVLASQRYGGAWSGLGSEWLEKRVEEQFLGNLAEALERGASASEIRQSAYLVFDFYDTHYKAPEGWALISHVLQKWPPPPEEQYLVRAREARALLAGGKEVAAKKRVRQAMEGIERLRSFDASWRLAAMRDLAKLVELPANPVLAIEVQQSLLTELDALTTQNASLKERFDTTLELVRLQGLVGDFVAITTAREEAASLASQLDEREDLKGGRRSFSQRLHLAEIKALELIPSRTEDANAKLNVLLSELQRIVPIHDKSPAELLGAIQEAQSLGKAKSPEDYLNRRASAEIQADALALRGFIQLRRGDFAPAMQSLEQALIVDFHRNGICGSPTQLQLWRGLALASTALQQIESSKSWFSEWASCSGAQSRDARNFAEALIAYGQVLGRSRDWLAGTLFLQRGLNILEASDEKPASTIASARLGLAFIALAQGHESEAMEQIGGATTALLKSPISGSEWKVHGRRALSLLTAQTFSSDEARVKALTLAFELGQKISSSHAAAGLSAFSYRAALKDTRLAALVQRTLELQRRRDIIDARLASLFSTISVSSNLQARAVLSQELGSLEGQLREQATSLNGFPSYQALVSGSSIPLEDLTHPMVSGWVLEANEALVTYMQSSDALFAVVISRQGAQLVQLDAPLDVVSRLVEGIRSSTKFSREEKISLPEFDLVDAQELQSRVWAPVRKVLGTAVKVTIVADGPLTSLPFELLPTASTAIGTRWLDDEVVLRYAPSVSSLAVLHKVRTGKASLPVIVLGPPSMPAVVEPAPDDRSSGFFRFQKRIGNEKTQMGDEISSKVLCDGTLGMFPPSITSMARNVASVLGGTDANVLLQERMLKSQLKLLSATGELAQYRNIAFVTHGLVAGQLVENASTEPALVFSPTTGCQDPELGTTALLSASEISELTLDADWVMLLACDTASADGTPGAEPLSGLARAFMFAGARSLLVSHWSVDVGATVRLVELLGSEHQSRSSMLQAARKQLRALPGYSHPAYWAGFSVVGADY